MKVEKENPADGKAAGSAVPSVRKADVPTRLAILRSLRQLHLLFLGLFSGKQDLVLKLSMHLLIHFLYQASNLP